MKRPFTIIGFALGLSLLFASAAGITASIIVAGVVFVCFIISVSVKAVRKYPEVSVAALVFVFGLLFYPVYDNIRTTPLAVLDNTSRIVRGYIYEETNNSGNNSYFTYKFKVTQIKDSSLKDFNILLGSDKEINAEPFDEIVCRVDFQAPENTRYFKEDSYYKGIGIFLLGRVTEVDSITANQKKPLYYQIIRWRRYSVSTLMKYLGSKAGGLASGILLGDKTDISENIIYNFRATGISHLLAVSGCHLAVITAFVMSLLGRIGISRRIRGIITIAVIIFFMALTGFSPSVMRAGITMTVYLAGIAIKKQADSLNSLGFAVFIMLIFNPFGVLNIGFQLSVTATLGILTLGKKITSYIAARLGKIYKMPVIKQLVWTLCQSVSAMVATLPVIAITFNEISVIAPLTNIFAVPAASAVVIFAGLTVVFSLLGPLSVLANIFSIVCGLFSKILIQTTSLLAAAPFALQNIGYIHIKLWLAFSFILFAIGFIILPKAKRYFICGLLSLAVLVTANTAYYFAAKGEVRVSVVDSYSGGVGVITERGRTTVIYIDADWDYSGKLNQALKDTHAGKIDTLIIGGLTTRAQQGIEKLLSNWNVSRIYTDRMYNTLLYNNCSAELFDRTIDIDNGINIELETINNRIKAVNYNSFDKYRISFVNLSEYKKEHNIPSNLTIVYGEYNPDIHTINSNYTVYIKDKDKEISDRNKLFLGLNAGEGRASFKIRDSKLYEMR